jgi:hypothetical protein
MTLQNDDAVSGQMPGKATKIMAVADRHGLLVGTATSLGTTP